MYLRVFYRMVNGEVELNHIKKTFPSHHLTYEAKGLQPHFEYQFWVTASTKIGEGQSSKVATHILSTTRSECDMYKPFSRFTYNIFLLLVVPAKIVSFGGLIEKPWRTFVKLPCTAIGQPIPKKQWLKSSRAIQSWDNNVRLIENGDMTITSLQRSNSDNYTCHVENIHGTDSIVYQIIVQGIMIKYSNGDMIPSLIHFFNTITYLQIK